MTPIHAAILTTLLLPPQGSTSKPTASMPSSAPTSKPKSGTTDQDKDIQELRRALAEKVTRAHGRGETPAAIRSFEATIGVTTLGKEADNISMDLEVRYRNDGKVPRIRYSVDEGSKRLERGLDERGPWMVGADGKAKGLRDRKHKTDAEKIASHIRLCDQMARFLEPGAILRTLHGDDAPAAKKLRVGRKEVLDAVYLNGRQNTFPLFRETDEVKQGAVFMEAWVDPKTWRLRALRIYPDSATGKPARTRGEFVMLADYAPARDKSGVLLPTEITYFHVDGEERSPQAQVALKRFTLNPKLGDASFRRPAN